MPQFEKKQKNAQHSINISYNFFAHLIFLSLFLFLIHLDGHRDHNPTSPEEIDKNNVWNSWDNMYSDAEHSYSTTHLKGDIASTGTATFLQQRYSWTIIIWTGAIITAIIHTQWLRCSTHCSAGRNRAPATTVKK